MSDAAGVKQRGKAEATTSTAASADAAAAAAAAFDTAEVSRRTTTTSVALTRTPSERLAAKLQRDASDATKGDVKMKRDAAAAAVETVPIEEPEMNALTMTAPEKKAETAEDPSGAEEAEEARAAANAAAVAAASAQTPPGAVPVAGMGATDAPDQTSSPSHVREPYDPTCREPPQWPEIVEVKATLVPDDDEESPTAPVTVSAVAAEASDFFIDTKSTRVRCLGLLACLVIVGAVAGGVYAATRPSSPSTSPAATASGQFASGPTGSPTTSPTPSPTVLDWNIVGPEVFGQNTNDRFGWSVSLSSGARSRFAASAPSNPKILKYLEAIGAPTGSIGLVFVCTEDRRRRRCWGLVVRAIAPSRR